MNQRIAVPAPTLGKVIKYVEVTSAMTKRALDQLAVHEQVREKAAALQAPLLTHMIECGVVAPHQKEAAAAMLASPETALQLLKSAVDKIVELKKDLAKTASEPGSADNVKTAGDDGYNSLTDPHVGAKSANVKESDKALLRLIGK